MSTITVYRVEHQGCTQGRTPHGGKTPVCHGPATGGGLCRMRGIHPRYGNSGPVPQNDNPPMYMREDIVCGVTLEQAPNWWDCSTDWVLMHIDAWEEEGWRVVEYEVDTLAVRVATWQCVFNPLYAKKIRAHSLKIFLPKETESVNV